MTSPRHSVDSPLPQDGSPRYQEKSPVQLLASMRRQFVLDMRQEKKSILTIEWYTKRLTKFEADTGIRTLEGITRPAFQQWLVDLMETGSDTYVENCFRAMRGFLGWCRRMGFEWHPSLIGPEGRFSVRKPTIQEEAIEVFSAEEAHKLLAWPLNPRDALIVRMGLQTGIRYPSELLRLEVQDVDHRPGLGVAGYLNIHGKRSKQRWVPINHQLMAALDFYIQRVRGNYPGPELILGRWGRPLTYAGVRKIMDRLTIATGLHVHGYKFRHTFATQYLRENRGDIEGLRKMLGHEDYKTLRSYLKLVREDIGDNWESRVPFGDTPARPVDGRHGPEFRR